MTSFRHLVNAALMTAALFFSCSASAVYQEIDAIVAVVEEDVVLASELKSRYDQVVRQMKEQKMQLPQDEVLVSQIMERLVLESIQHQEAARRGVEIDDETLTRAVMSFAQGNNLTLEQFQQALAADGIGYRQFREEIRSEMLISRLQRNLINRRISISDKDIQGLLNSPYYQQLFSDEYRVGHILLSLAERASDEAEAKAEAEAAEIVAELRGGADFAQMAIARSSSSRALEGGDLGWRRAGELPSLFSEDVLEMQVGDIADPIRTSGAIHIIKLLEQRGAGTQTIIETNVRHILVRPSEIRSPQETQELIQEIKQEIDGGADFAELAKTHSQDPASALNGGDLGWSPPDAFVGQFGEAMAAQAIGGVSEPFLTQFGWHILQVLDRREQDMSDEARKNMAVEILHKRRFEEEQEEWLKEIRDEAFVELRL
ncbi:peptidylprolyl isomerase [bacterium]|jgi:peptidyl-prolyl cis-trans isomerase SurA|nr:molecular chaperone SurA [Gammaproteobacteria bacterium]MDC0559351.1 peptidylprolyl isomerase [bacterium]